VYALSNNHVYALENTVSRGTDVLQPGLADTQCSPTGSDVIGSLSAFAPIAFCNRRSCPSNTIDAAIAVSDATKLDNKTPPAGYGTPSSTTVPDAVGQSVQKYGRTTSLTTGQVTGIDATIRVGYLTGTAQFVHQIVVSSCPTTCIGAGDSGSLLVTNDASLNPVGLLFAGNSSGSMAIANPIDAVLSYFGVAVDGSSPSSAPPAIGLSPGSFSFSAPVGGPDPASQTLSISNTGGGTLSWTASADATWLTLAPTSGTAPSSVAVSASTTGLGAGSYRGTITVSAPGASNSPQTAAVSLTVTASSGSPVASFTHTCSRLNCSFDASGSTGASTYGWGFGDGATGSGVTVSHTFAPSASYTVTLTVANTAGAASSTSQVLTCNPVLCH
jgi:PKD repeat protein